MSKKYHKHQSKGLDRPNYQATSRLRCPVTGKLIEPFTGCNVVVDLQACEIVTPVSKYDGTTRSRKTFYIHCGSMCSEYALKFSQVLGVTI